MHDVSTRVAVYVPGAGDTLIPERENQKARIYGYRRTTKECNVTRLSRRDK